uniref:Uncharacterized protein n=1 Tax=Anguilla anguilla TaxID=7936 RepID=A0A0E9TYL6_ANGAN
MYYEIRVGGAYVPFELYKV